MSHQVKVRVSPLRFNFEIMFYSNATILDFVVILSIHSVLSNGGGNCSVCSGLTGKSNDFPQLNNTLHMYNILVSVAWINTSLCYLIYSARCTLSHVGFEY